MGCVKNKNPIGDLKYANGVVSQAGDFGSRLRRDSLEGPWWKKPSATRKIFQFFQAEGKTVPVMFNHRD
jgi:hypothetical protein